MQYLYHAEASNPILELFGDEHRYIFKVRRHRVGETISLRNLNDELLYSYLIESMDKKTATLRLIEQKELRVSASKKLHIAWCIIEPKSIEKVLPTLNEIGISKISFIYCSRSQKQFKVDLQRLQKIILNSSQQSGRSNIMEFDIVESLERFVELNPQSYLLNFSKRKLGLGSDIETIVIGCEGGFSDDELRLFGEQKVVGLNTPMILRSESAVCAVASRLLV